MYPLFKTKCRSSFLMVVLSFMMILSPQSTAFYDRHEQGWFWYKSQPLVPKVLPKKQGSASHEPKVLSAQDQIKKIQESLEEATARAILQPTLAHVQEVMTLQRHILNRSSQFQDTWMQASLFEAQHARPQDATHPLARALHKQKEEQQLGQKIRGLAKTTGLFFVFSSTCPHCHTFAPVVKQFAQDYGFEIKAISKDGASLKEFPEVSKDNGMIARLNPQGIYPALFLAHPSSGQVIPVAWGMANPTQLLENFATVIKALEEKTFHDR